MCMYIYIYIHVVMLSVPGLLPPRRYTFVLQTERLLRTAAAEILADLHVLGALWKIIVQRGPNPR